MGVPILTLPGQTHASRVTASLLHRVGLDRWAAQSEKAFLQIGSLAAQNPTILQQLSQELPHRVANLPEPMGQARDQEYAYREMWQTFCYDNASAKFASTARND